MALASLFVKLGLNSGEFRKDLKKSSKRARRFSRDSQRAFNSVSKSVKGMVAAYAGFRVLSSVIKTHEKFTSAISDLSAITGATGKDLEFLTQKSKEFGATTTLSASQAAEAFKLVASAKPDLLDNAQALATVTKEAIALAEAAGTSLPDAAKTLGSALNQFGADADEAGRFINVLAAGAKFGASEIEDTALALKDSGLVASSAGTSFEELNAAIQTLSTVSLKGAEAGVGLRNVYLNLAIQSNDKFKPSVVGLTAAIQNLKKAQLSDIELLEIFGKKNIVAAKALIKQSDVLSGLTGKLTDTATAYEQAAIKNNNLGGDVKRLGSAWESVSIMLGEKLDPALRGITQAMTWMAKVVKSLIIALADMGDALDAYAAAAAAALALDFSSASAILELRDKEATLNEKALAAVWEKVEANNVLAEQEKAMLSAKAANDAIGAGLPDNGKDTISIVKQEKMAADLEKFRESLLSQEEAENEHYARRLEQLNTAEQNNIATLMPYSELKERLEQEHQNKLTQIQKRSMTDAERFNAMSYKKRIQTTLQAMEQMSRGVANQSRTAFKIHKALALANAVVSLPSAVMQSFENGGGYPWGLIPAGLMLYTGIKQIQAIKNTHFGGGGGVAPSLAGSGGGGAPVSTTPSQSPIDVGLGGAANDSRAPQEIHVTIDGMMPTDPDQLDQLAESIADNLRNGGQSPVAA